MFVKDFYTQSENQFSFSRQQGSDFAKRIAGDFNPLHDPENTRFCVPGDLLFSLTLSKFGVSQSMTFDFQGMVGGDTPVQFIESAEQITVENDKQKCFLSVSREGEISTDQAFIEGLIRSYVAFSGKTFPHILVDLMQQQNTMTSAEKPMVIYDMMKIGFDRFSSESPEVVLKGSTFDVNGKRGLVTMNFDIQAQGEAIGHGEKHIIMSGLRPYEQAGIDALVANYEKSRDAYFQ
jgi:hypothetical protein